MKLKLTCLAAVCALFVAAGSASAQELGKGKVLFEYWDGISGTAVTDLTGNANYPNKPSSAEWRDSFASVADRGDNYGIRARALLTAPASGDYTFWVASDDLSELWLSTDATAANAVKIASVSSWTGANQWDKEAGQKSAPVTLEAGQQYYIEGLMKEGTGGDNFSVGWAGPEIGDAPVVIAGQYCTAFIRDPEPMLFARNPEPADGAEEVTSLIFSWTASVNAVSHDVYVSTEPVLGPNDLMSTGMSMAMYYHLPGFTPDTMYYWRVDEIGSDGVTYEGPVWSFKTMPIKSYDQSPYDGAIFRNVSTMLSWSAGDGAESHDVYFSTSFEDVNAAAEAAFVGNQTETTFDPNGLEYGTTYYWRVDEVDGAGQVVVGDVLSFSTMMEGMGGATFEVWKSNDSGAIADLLSEPNFPRYPDEVNIVSNMEAPTDYADAFGARISAWLTVPVAGDYTFWVASDDASQLFLGANKNSAQLIASVDSWTGSRAWDSMASQKSAAIHLDEGVYYLSALYKEGGGGDNCSVAWQGPAVPQRELVSDGFITPFVGLWADDAHPVDGAQGQPDRPVLDWQVGVGAVEHALYLGTDKNAVAAGNASTLKYQGTDNFFVPAALNWNTTYYWKVDEIDADGNVSAGFVWSFKVADYIPVIDDAITVNYDNTADPFITELTQEYVDPQDWTKNGVTSLQLDLKGNTAKFTVNGGTYTLMAAGADIWDSADQFRYAYKTLDGDGSMIARVVDKGTGSSEWAKGGVMIRQSTAAGSMHAFMPLTAGGGNGASFQRRIVADNGSSNADSSTAVTAPYWVRVVRVGNEFSGFISPDGADWTQLGDPVTIDMNDPVLIGLAVTSHASGELRTFTFDNVSMTGDVTGNWTVADIGVAQGGNDPAPVYVTLEDSNGKTATVQHPANPTVTTNTNWSTLKILTSQFGGINLKAITKITLGIGNGQADGTGAIQVANVKVVKPITVTVENASFEQPGSSSVTGIWFNKVPGWKTDSTPKLSSVIKGLHPTDGSWSAVLVGGDPSIWQITGHTITDGEAFVLTLDASVANGAIRDSSNLKISLVYDDGGKRVSLGSMTTALPWDAKTYTLEVSAANARKGAGHKLGIEVVNVSDNSISVDKVRLKTK